MLQALLILSILAQADGGTPLPVDAPIAVRADEPKAAQALSPFLASTINATATQQSYSAAFMVPGIVNLLSGGATMLIANLQPPNQNSSTLTMTGAVTAGIGLLFVVVGAGLRVGANASLSAATADPETGQVRTSRDDCCVVCLADQKPCGSGCVAKGALCNKFPGCACAN